MVLTHLIMNDMMKVKGHIARMALCLQDPHPRIKDLAHLFFHELAQKNYKVRALLVSPSLCNASVHIHPFRGSSPAEQALNTC